MYFCVHCYFYTLSRKCVIIQRIPIHVVRKAHEFFMDNVIAEFRLKKSRRIRLVDEIVHIIGVFMRLRHDVFWLERHRVSLLDKQLELGLIHVE